MMAARTVLLLVLLVHVLAAAAAARPLEGRASAGTTAAGVWLESGIGMVTELLRAAKSGPNPRTHCC
ncbi:hypothetical protein GQ55_7G103800 [Panicum hallii var. hallii]|uniref:Uncharacterized protein n=1 Tax=Panicum hallii var. hallii TaxID=1504633 RepID=A0A2T7CTY5_9POAL|nr:hypothetical protein GQ55_7G103800 [Panicum hallii var. hallii]